MLQILVIDDDEITQLTLTRILEQQGYQVITASNGEDGLAQAKKSPPALIICDWLMPGMDGIEVCRQVKATPQLSATFFIVLTSLDSVADVFCFKIIFLYVSRSSYLVVGRTLKYTSPSSSGLTSIFLIFV